MNKIYLKYISVSNFASFAECIQFTTVAENNKREFLENTFVVDNDRLNKVSFVYGANGSGKTFFCKILREIQRLLDWSPLSAINNPQLLAIPSLKGIDEIVPTFAFDLSYCDKPTVFSIEFLMDGTTYHYEFSIMKKKIIYELLTKRNKRTEKLLERSSSSFKDINLRSEFKSFEKNKHVVKDEALCLPMAAFLNNSLAIRIVEAISGINVLNMTALRVRPNSSEKSFSEERLNKYKAIMQRADPTLRKLSISIEEEETSRQKIEFDDFENREIIAKKMIYDVKTEHAVFSQQEEIDITSIDFLNDESLGTVKLFTALPYLFDVLEDGGVLVLDEIDNGLHLSLVKEIVMLFTNENSNPHGAQLICTTHQPLLINGEIRRDQVWVIHKDKYGKSGISRMSELSTSHSKINLANKLIEGALGYNPEQFFASTHK